MSYYWTPTALNAVMAGLVTDVAAALVPTLGGKVNRACVIPGSQAAWDNCQCGQLTLMHTRTFRSRNFPQDATGQFTKCDDFKLVYDMTMTLVRCVPGTLSGGQPPACEALAAANAVQESDAFVVWTTVDCSLSQLAEVNLVTDYIINDQTAVGPQGQCAGTELHFQVGLFPPCPCG